MSADVGEVEDGKGAAGEAAYLHLVGGRSGGCADGGVVRSLGVWELNTPVSLLFVADHGEHKGHVVVDTLDTAVGARVVGTGGNLIDAEALVEGEGTFGAKLESVIGKQTYGASPERHISVNKDVGRAGGGELGLCSGVRVGTAAAVVRKKEDVGVASKR